MRFQVRDLMSNVLPMGMAENPCTADSTRGHECPPCPPPSCQGQSGCPQPSQRRPPKASREMLSVLRDQMRQALLPA